MRERGDGRSQYVFHADIRPRGVLKGRRREAVVVAAMDAVEGRIGKGRGSPMSGEAEKQQKGEEGVEEAE